MDGTGTFRRTLAASFFIAASITITVECLPCRRKVRKLADAAESRLYPTMLTFYFENPGRRPIAGLKSYKEIFKVSRRYMSRSKDTWRWDTRPCQLKHVRIGYITSNGV